MHHRRRHNLSLRDALRHFAPSLIEFLDLKPREWRKAENKLAERNAILQNQFENSGGSVAAKTTIYDLMVEAYLGNIIAVRFLSYIDSIVSRLIQLIPEQLQPSVRLQARNLFLQFSEKSSNYLEKVGELAAMLYILEKTGAKPLEFEAKMTNKNTSLDLSIEFENGHSVAVEIMNVWIDDKKLSDDKGLHSFLDGRISKKILEKTGHHLPVIQLPFPLLLVLWFQDVKNVSRFAKAIISRAQGNELPACTILQYLNDQNQKNWIFSSFAELVSKGQLELPVCLQ